MFNKNKKVLHHQNRMIHLIHLIWLSKVLKPSWDTLTETDTAVPSLNSNPWPQTKHFNYSNWATGKKLEIIHSLLTLNGTNPPTTKRKRVRVAARTNYRIKVMVLEMGKDQSVGLETGDCPMPPSTDKPKLVITGKLPWNYNPNWIGAVQLDSNKAKMFKLVSTVRSANIVISLLLLRMVTKLISPVPSILTPMWTSQSPPS
jgi:hypothetical protein